MSREALIAAAALFAAATLGLGVPGAIFIGQSCSKDVDHNDDARCKVGKILLLVALCALLPLLIISCALLLVYRTVGGAGCCSPKVVSAQVRCTLQPIQNLFPDVPLEM